MNKKKIFSACLNRSFTTLLVVLLATTNLTTTVLADTKEDDSMHIKEAVLLRDEQPLDLNAVLAPDTALMAKYTVSMPNEKDALEFALPSTLAFSEYVKENDRYTIEIVENNLRITRKAQGDIATQAALSSPDLDTSTTDELIFTLPCKIKWVDMDTPVIIELGNKIYNISSTEKFQYFSNISITRDGKEPTVDNPLPAGNQALQIEYTFEYIKADYDKIENGFVVNLPYQLTISENIDFPLMSVDNTEIGNVKIGSSTLTFTFKRDLIKKYDSIKGYFGYEVTFTPQDNSGKEDLSFKVKTNEIAKLTVHYTKTTVHPKISKTQEPCTLCNDVKCHKWNVTITPGNEIHTPLLLKESMKDITLIENANHPITWNENTLTASDYTYDSGTLSYITPSFADLTQVQSFTYYTYNDNEVYLRSESSTLSSTSSLYGKTTGGSDIYDKEMTLDSDSKIKASFDVKPALITKEYEFVKEDNKIKALKWTITINGDSIPMSNLEFYINTVKRADGKNTYLELDSSSIVPKSDTNWNHDISKQDGYNYAMGYGTNAYIGKNEGISKTQTITFTTNVDQSFYNENVKDFTFDIDVKIKWWYRATGEGDGISGEMSGEWLNNDSKPPLINSSVIKKTFIKYEPSTNEITWEILINENKNSLTNIVVTDTIADNQEFSSIDGGIYSIAGNVVTITYGSLTTAKTITLKTKLNFATSFNNKEDTYSNTATITADELPNAQEHTTSKEIGEDLFKKSGVYDRPARTIKWVLTVNESEKSLKEVKITDQLAEEVKDKLAYVDGTFKVDNVSATPTITDGIISYNFPSGEINTKKVITFDTIVIDDTLFMKNEATPVINNATMEFSGKDNDGTYKKAENLNTTAKVNVDASVITKSSGYKSNTSIIPWSVTVNQDYRDITNAVIKDTFEVSEAGDKEAKDLLSLNTAGMKLIGYIDGSDTTGTQIDIVPSEPSSTQAKLVYHHDSSSFTLHLPTNETMKAYKYVLDYTINVTNKNPQKFKVTNKAEFQFGDHATPQSTSNTVNVAQMSGGASGSSDEGEITINVKDTSLDNINIENATVELSNKFGVVEEKITTETGTVTFDKLVVGSEYTAKIVSIDPNYYVEEFPSSKVLSITTSNKKLDHTFEFKRKSDKSLSVTMEEKDDSSIKLEDAEFTLTSKVGSPITNITGSDGSVTFDGLLSGVEYTLTGSYTNVNYNDFSVPANETFIVGDGNIEKVFLAEVKKTGSLEIILLDAKSKSVPMPDVTFILTAPSGSFVETVTDEDGIALFEELSSGKEYDISLKNPENDISVGEDHYVHDAISTFTITATPDKITTEETTSKLLKNGKITVTKRGRLSGLPIAGATYSLFKLKVGGDITRPEDLVFVDEGKTLIDGTVSFTRLIDGAIYIIKETKSAPNFPLDDKIETFFPTEDAPTLEHTFEAEIINGGENEENGNGGNNGSENGGNTENGGNDGNEENGNAGNNGNGSGGNNGNEENGGNDIVQPPTIEPETKPTTDTKTETNKENVDTSPQTGDTSFVGLWLFTAASSLLLAFIASKQTRRKKSK